MPNPSAKSPGFTGNTCTARTNQLPGQGECISGPNRRNPRWTRNAPVFLPTVPFSWLPRWLWQPLAIAESLEHSYRDLRLNLPR
jgi:hypothetical protein